VIAGFNLKQTILDSKGTVYIDTNGKINVFQWGAYAQVTKKLAKEKLILSASGRYDKNENFDGHFTPRFTAVISPVKNHNIRLSYQTAYRFPTNTDMFLRLNIGSGVYLLGGLPWVMDYMNTKQYPVYKIKDDGTPEPNPYQYKDLEPETSRSFETGYKGLIKNKLLIDFYFYLARYENFLGRNIMYQPATSSSYSIVTNSTAIVKTYGWGIMLDYLLPKQFNLLLAVYSDEITDIPTTFTSGFNTPKYRVNAGLSNSGFGKNKLWGFNLTFRWQDEFLYERDFATGIVKAFSTIDAQVNYKLLKIKSVIKLGATNLTNQYYQNAFGNPMIGGLYYISYAYNLL
jgi:outer membrane receptor protein involved in Fe transport